MASTSHKYMIRQ